MNAKKIFTREVRIGLMTVVAIFVLYYGLSFLKGIDIFSSVTTYYTSYENIGGLVPSSPVFVKGYKVGQVEEIQYDFTKKESFVVKFSIVSDVKIPKGAKIELFDDGLMGGKALQLIMTEALDYQNLHQVGDRIESIVGVGLMAQLSGELMPKIENIATQADSLLRAIRTVVESDQLNNSLSSIEKTTADLAVTTSRLKGVMTHQIPGILSDVNVLTSDFKQISGKLKGIDYAATFASIDHTIANLNLMTQKINNTEGSIGLLLNDKNLYLNLTNTASSADKLLIDLKENPKRYVNISVFGSKQK